MSESPSFLEKELKFLLYQHALAVHVLSERLARQTGDPPEFHKFIGFEAALNLSVDLSQQEMESLLSSNLRAVGIATRRSDQKKRRQILDEFAAPQSEKTTEDNCMFLQIGNSIFSLSQIAHATYCEADPDAPDTDRTLIIQFAGVAKPNFYYGDDADIAWQILCSHCVTSIKSSSRESTAANGFNPNGYVYGYPKTTNRGEDLMS